MADILLEILNNNYLKKELISDPLTNSEMLSIVLNTTTVSLQAGSLCESSQFQKQAYLFCKPQRIQYKKEVKVYKGYMEGELKSLNSSCYM